MAMKEGRAGAAFAGTPASTSKVAAAANKPWSFIDDLLLNRGVANHRIILAGWAERRNPLYLLVLAASMG
ncbi:hypothetical protein GCM10027066_20740 [Dyella jejuensis]